jgi:hypothetical protein
MMGFQCSYDRFGDIVMADGVVVQPRTGARFSVGAGTRTAGVYAGRGNEEIILATGARGGTFLGGSGNAMISSGLVAGLSSGRKPTGFFRPISPGIWMVGGFVLTVTGSSAATISDGTGIVANLTTGGTAPVGDYDSTSYGATHYNGGTAFTLAVAGEAGAGGFPSAMVEVTAGTVQTGTFESVDQWNYESVDDADWTISVAADGSADLLHLTDVIATRPAGNSPANPAGIYAATTAGKAVFNLTAEEPIDGEPFDVLVGLVGRVPRVGYVYLELEEDAGDLVAVRGPFFGATLPAPSGDLYYVEIAYSDGFAMRQDQLGTIIWP